MEITNLIVGSGPSAAGAALALDNSLVVDLGLGLPEQVANQAAKMGATPFSAWSSHDIEWLTTGLIPHSSGVDKKLSFGSDYSYQYPKELDQWRLDGRASLSPAFGGFSTVWGASVLPYSTAELQGWPFGLEELAPHYRAILQETGLAAECDELESVFPLYHSKPEPIVSSVQTKITLERWERHRGALTSAGLRWGKSRLLVRGSQSGATFLSYVSNKVMAGESGCVRCGCCLYGCPYDHIYSSRRTLRSLAEKKTTSYLPGVAVKKFEERSNSVKVIGETLADGRPWMCEAKRLFLGAGVLASTKIVMQSLGLIDRPVEVLDSQYFTIPLLCFGSFRNVREERLHTLAQIFLQILNPKLSPELIHLQLYSYNGMITRLLEQKAGILQRPFDPLIRELEGRLFFLQGYLHSNQSGRLRMTFPQGQGATTNVSCLPNYANRKIIKRVVRHLFIHFRGLGFVPIFPLLSIGQPGRGFHYGGTMPMGGCSSHSPLVTDLIGRPCGLRRVHVVDSSVFPTIPATTITLTAMANAHRIATEAGKLKA